MCQVIGEKCKMISNLDKEISNLKKKVETLKKKERKLTFTLDWIKLQCLDSQGWYFQMPIDFFVSIYLVVLVFINICSKPRRW